MVEDLIYRGETEDERIESAVTYTSLMNLFERFRAGHIYCTSHELAAFAKCMDIAVPYWVEVPQQPQGQQPQEVVPVPPGVVNPPPDGGKAPRRIRQIQ